MPRILVLFKACWDVESLGYNSNTREPIFNNVPATLGDYERNAIQTAVDLQATNLDFTIEGLTVATMDHGDNDKVYTDAISRGGGKKPEDFPVTVLQVPTELFPNPANTAKVLGDWLKKQEDIALIIGAQVSNDYHTGIVPPALAEVLNYPFLGNLAEIKVEGQEIRGKRNEKVRTVFLKALLPAVCTVTDEVNTPSIPKLLAIRKAKKSGIVKKEPVEPAEKLTAIKKVKTIRPVQNRKSILIEEGSPEEKVDALMEYLKKETILEDL